MWSRANPRLYQAPASRGRSDTVCSSSGSAPDQLKIVGIVAGDFGAGLAVLERTDAIEQRKYRSCRPPHQRAVDVFRFDGCDEFGATVLRRPRHLEVEPRLDPFAGRVQAVPVAHDHTIETPFAAQDVFQQKPAGTTRFVEGAVISSHHRFDFCIDNQSLESG